MGHRDWLSQTQHMLLLGWGAAQPQHMLLSHLFCWQLSLGSCACRWWPGHQSSGKLTKESRKEGAGKWKGEDGRADHEIQFCSPGFYKLAHQQSFFSDMLHEQKWIAWPNHHLSHYLMYFFRSLLISFLLAQSKYFHPNHPCCPSLNIPFSNSPLFLSRLSCTQCSGGENNSDLYEGIVIPFSSVWGV